VHAIHPEFRRLLAAGCAAFVLTVAALALAPAAGEIELRLGGGSEAASGTSAPAVRAEPSQPRWLADPLSPPAFSIR
jgi:hypothetical protein